MRDSPLKMWLALAVVVGSIAWFFYKRAAETPLYGNSAYGEPLQDSSAVKSPFDYRGYQLTPIAHFDLRARLISSQSYRGGREADISPIDYALGWNRMSDDAVLAQLRFSQAGRFYSYRWDREPPIPPAEIIRSSANMHLVPANSFIERELSSARPGSVVTISGWLIDVDNRDGWRWRTSRTREDSGSGACEIIWVESFSVEQRTSN